MGTAFATSKLPCNIGFFIYLLHFIMYSFKILKMKLRLIDMIICERVRLVCGCSM